MTKSINKNSNKNVINIKIGETKKKRKRRTKQKKSQGGGGYIINNVVQPQIQPQYNAPNYPPEQPIHPSVFHQNRTQSFDMTSQVDKEGLANKRNAYFNNLFQNPNETQAPNISATNTSDDNNELLKTAFKAIKRDAILNKRNELLADAHYENKLKQKTFKNIIENINDSQMNAKADEFRNRYKNKPMSEEKAFTLKDNAFSGLVENNFYEKYIKSFEDAQSKNYEFLNKLDKKREKIDEQVKESFENYDMRINDYNANDPSNVKYRKSTPILYKKQQILTSESPFKINDENLDFTEFNRNISNPDDFARKYENKTVNKKLVNFFSPNKFAPLISDDEEEAPQLLNQIKEQPIEELEKEFEALTGNNISPSPKKERTDEEIRKRRVDIFKSIARNEENKNKLQDSLLEDSENLFGDKNYVNLNYENDFQEFEKFLENKKNNLEGERKNKFIRYLKYYGKSRQGISGERVKNETALQKLNSMRAEQAKLIANLPKS